MTGAMIDYVITGIDRGSDCCTASRRSAMYVRRKAFTKLTPKVGKKVPVSVMEVGAAHLLANCGGFDLTLSQRDLSYSMLGDLRDKYHPGETLTGVLKEYDEENQSIKVSVKEAEPHPFDSLCYSIHDEWYFLSVGVATLTVTQKVPFVTLFLFSVTHLL